MLWLLGAHGALAVGSAFTGVETSEDDETHDAETGSTGGVGHEDDGAERSEPCLIQGVLSDGDGDVQDQTISGVPSGSGSAGTYDLLTGAEGDDTLSASDGPAFLTGRGGDDLLTGAGDADQINGGTGLDTLVGNGGDDTLYGESGDDTLYGKSGDDDLFGAEGDDSLAGGSGDDSLAGGDGQDTVHGGAGADAVHGLQGNDALAGGAGADTLFGGTGNDHLVGNDDAGETDFLNGGDGADTITAGAGDVVSSGNGADWIGLEASHEDEAPAFVTDFSTDEDQIEITFDAEAGIRPVLSIEADDDNAAVFHILLDDIVVARVMSDGPLGPEHISLRPDNMMM
ncbi:MAG: calcium-binding protein [Pseudomonadota bacterium]